MLALPGTELWECSVECQQKISIVGTDEGADSFALPPYNQHPSITVASWIRLSWTPEGLRFTLTQPTATQ
jgi:hypothetical protein